MQYSSRLSVRADKPISDADILNLYSASVCSQNFLPSAVTSCRQDKQCAIIAARPLVEYCPFCFQLIRSRVQGLKIPRSESGTLSGFVRLKEFLDLIVIIIVVKPLPYLAAAF